MKLNLRNLTAFTALLGASTITSAAYAQLHFNFTFNPGTGTTGGSGGLDLGSDPGNGTFLYNALSPTYTFTVNGDTYTQADYVSNPALSQLAISDLGGGLRGLAFSNTGVTGGGGPQGGSVDLNHAGKILSFSPSNYPGPGVAYFENASGIANYSTVSGTAAATPEPGSLALMAGVGLSGAAFLRRRKRTQKTV